MLTNSQQYSPGPPSFPFLSHPAGLYSDPLDDVLRSLTATYNTQPLPQQHHYPQPEAGVSDLLNMAPPQQSDPIALAWLQLLQSQAPTQHDSGIGSSSRVQADIQGHPEQPPTQPTHLPDNPVNPEEENDSEEDTAATAEDKRRRNTAASGYFSRCLPL